MPFTLVNPAAALPIWRASRSRLRLAALAIGAVVPDFEYFRHLNTQGSFAHSLPGLLAFCLPVGWLSLWLFDRFGRAGVQVLLPPSWLLPAPPRPLYPIARTFLAILLGAASHIAWDAFTHASGWEVRTWPQLSALVPTPAGPVPWFKLLQHGSNLLGLAILAAACWGWARRQPPVPGMVLFRRSLLPSGPLAAAVVANGARFLAAGFQQFVVAGGVAVSFATGLGLILLGALAPRMIVGGE
jgi:hypothetical protein